MSALRAVPPPQRGIFLDVDTVDRGDLDRRRFDGVLEHWVRTPAVRWRDHRPELAGFRVAVTNKVVVDEAVLAGAADLQLVCVAATGTNNVDLEAARRRGVTVCNVAGYATASVVQHVFALVLALRTRLRDYAGAVEDGAWQKSTTFCLLDYPVSELAGGILGIVGYGELGGAVARVARAFGMEVVVARRPGTEDPRPGRLPLDELLETADVVSLHCPLTPATRGLLGRRELGLMGPDALLVNTARGGLVDEAALAAALRAGTIGGAGVDVLSREPPGGDNPLLEPGIPNLIVTPHSAWISRQARQRLLDQVAANIEGFLAGRPRNVVAGPAPAGGGGSRRAE